MVKQSVLDHQYRRNVLQALLVESRSEEKPYLPTIPLYVLSELANGTLAYVESKNTDRVTYAKWKDHDEHLQRRSFEPQVWEAFEPEIPDISRKLHAEIAGAVTSFVECDQRQAPPERPYWQSNFEDEYKGPWAPLCNVSFQSKWSLPMDMASRVRREIMPSLSERERKDVKGIANEMSPRIDKDLEHIRGRYMW